MCEEKEKEDNIGCGRKLFSRYLPLEVTRWVATLWEVLFWNFLLACFFLIEIPNFYFCSWRKFFFVICYFGETRCKSLCKLELSVTIWDCWKSKWIMQIRFITSWEQTLKTIVFLSSYHSLCSSCLETFFCFFSKFTSLVVSLNENLDN